MLGLRHEVAPADVLEVFLPGEVPEGHVVRLAREKVLKVAAFEPDALVLAADTVVVVDGDVLGKPATVDGAVEMLLRLSSRDHEVLTALALVTPGGAVHERLDRTRVTFRAFGSEEARAYAETGEPLDKAGAYGIQGLGAALVQSVSGDPYTVVGLPVSGLVRLLEQAGWRYAFGGGLDRVNSRPTPLPEIPPEAT
jgi:septum formation protein